MTLAFISHPDCLLHGMGNSHPESPARLQVIADAVKNSDLHSKIKYKEVSLFRS